MPRRPRDDDRGGAPPPAEDPHAAAERRKRGRAKAQRTLSSLLRGAGLPDSAAGSLNPCLLTAVHRRLLGTVRGGRLNLDRVLLKRVRCQHCAAPAERSVRVRDVLLQPAAGVPDGATAPLRCGECGRGTYLSKVCTGFPQAEAGRRHWHCAACARCYNAPAWLWPHCGACGEHYWASGGASEAPDECPCRSASGALAAAAASAPAAASAADGAGAGAPPGAGAQQYPVDDAWAAGVDDAWAAGGEPDL